MALDPTRAQLVSSAYRYKTIDDASIKAQYPNAREIVIDTSLDETSAGYLAQATFNSTKNASRTYEVVVRDRVLLDDFLDGAPRYKVDFGSRHPAALAMGAKDGTGLVAIDKEGTWEFSNVIIGREAINGPIYLTAGLHAITITGAATYRSPAMISAGQAATALDDSRLRHPIDATYTVIGATTRLRAGTTTLTVRA